MCIYVLVHVCMHVCSYMRACVCMCVVICVHVYAFGHAFVCIHILCEYILLLCYLVFLYTVFIVDKMAEGPDPANHSSGDKSSPQEEQEPVVVEPDVTCGHCKRELNNPYLLCCLHSVCGECLPNMVVENGHLKCTQCGDTSTHCNDRRVLESECRVDSLDCVPVPNGPLARYIEGMKIVQKVTQNVPIPCGSKRCKSGGSPSAIFCTDCTKFLCKLCYGAHEMLDEYENHTVKTLEVIRSLRCQDIKTLSPKNTTPSTCPQHNGNALEYCCEQCDVLMCQACAIDLKPPHNPKHLSTKSTVFDHHTQSVKITRKTAVCYERKYQKIEKEFRTQIKTVDEMKEAALHDINAAFQNIHQVVDERKEELCRQVIATAENKKHTISSKLTAAEREREMSANTQSSLQFLLTSGTSHDVIASKDLVQTQQSVLISKWCQEEFESTVSQVVTFDPTNQDVLLKAIREFGIVEDGACPVNCTVEPKLETVHWDGSDSLKLTLNTYNSKNIRCKQGGDNVEAFLRPKPPIISPAIKVRVVDDENGQYTLSFPITYPGECDLSILVNGSDVRGSPFGVDLLPKPKPGELNKNVRKLKTNKGYLNFPQQPGGPWGIAVAPNGHTFIADHTNHQIHVFDEQRKHIRSFGQPGSGNGQLQNPEGVAVDAEGLVYVADYGNSRIEVFREDGTFVRQFGTGELGRPWRVTVNNKLVYVGEWFNCRIAIFTLEGQLIRTIGSQGSGPGQFNSPTAPAISTDGDMYVADDYNHRIQVFNSDGVYQREFGGGQVKNPYDILITADGHVLVADYGNNCVVIFNTTGQIIHSFQVPSQPYGLAIDHNGDLLVTLYSDKQVAVF